MRSICGVEVDLDLDHAKPIRLPPHRLSPAKTEIAKALVQVFIEEMARRACPRDVPHLPRRRRNPKKTRLPHLFEETKRLTTNRGVGLRTVRTERWSDTIVK